MYFIQIYEFSFKLLNFIVLKNKFACNLLILNCFHSNFDHKSSNLDINISNDSESLILYKIYRKKLQYFLQVS